jgi:hypothetical protein
MDNLACLALLAKKPAQEHSAYKLKTDHDHEDSAPTLKSAFGPTLFICEQLIGTL